MLIKQGVGLTMKKRTIVIIIILIAFIVVPYVVGVIDRHVISFDKLCVPAYNSTIQYPQEENTVIVIGNGRFQVMKYKENEKHEQYSDYYLFDVKEQKNVEPYVMTYAENKSEKQFYLMGASEYITVIDYQLEKISYSNLKYNGYDLTKYQWTSLNKLNSEDSESN